MVIDDCIDHRGVPPASPREPGRPRPRIQRRRGRGRPGSLLIGFAITLALFSSSAPNSLELAPPSRIPCNMGPRRPRVVGRISFPPRLRTRARRRRWPASRSARCNHACRAAKGPALPHGRGPKQRWHAATCALGAEGHAHHSRRAETRCPPFTTHRPIYRNVYQPPAPPGVSPRESIALECKPPAEPGADRRTNLFQLIANS